MKCEICKKNNKTLYGIRHKICYNCIDELIEEEMEQRRRLYE